MKNAKASLYPDETFFTFLEQKELEYTQATVDNLAEFIAWLKWPKIYEKVIPMQLEPAVRAQTINANLDTVLGFYNYLLLHEEYENQLSQKLVKFVRSPQKNYRAFLNGIADKKREKRYLLHLPVPQQKIKTVAKEDVNTLIKATNNIRDYFLLYLLFETGMRIGEALSLWLEDFDISAGTITIHDRGEMENLSEIKTVSSPRRLDCTQDLLEVFTESVCFFHTEGIKTNHVFLKMMGKNAGKAMDYTDVDKDLLNYFLIVGSFVPFTFTPSIAAPSNNAPPTIGTPYLIIPFRKSLFSVSFAEILSATNTIFSVISSRSFFVISSFFKSSLKSCRIILYASTASF